MTMETENGFKFSQEMRNLYPDFYTTESERKIFTALESADPVFSTIYESTSGFVDNVFDINVCQSRYLPIISQTMGVDSFVTFDVLDYYYTADLLHVVTGFYDNYSRITPEYGIPASASMYEFTVSGADGEGEFLKYVNYLRDDALAVSATSGWYALVDTPYYRLMTLLSAPTGMADDSTFYCANEIYNNCVFIRNEREFLRETLLKLNAKGISNSLKATFMDYLLRAFSDEYRKNRRYSNLDSQTANNFNISIRELFDPWTYYTPWHEQTFRTQTFQPMSGMMDHYRQDSHTPMTSALAVTLINMFPAPTGFGLSESPFVQGVEINDIIRGLYYTADGYFKYRRNGVNVREFEDVSLTAPSGVITYTEALKAGVSGVIPNWSDYVTNERGIVATMQDPYKQFTFEDIFEYFSNKGKGEWNYTEHALLPSLGYEKNVRMWLPYRSLEESTNTNRYAPVSGNGEWGQPALSGFAGWRIIKSESDIYRNIYMLMVPGSSFDGDSTSSEISSAGGGCMFMHQPDREQDIYGDWQLLVLPKYDLNGSIRMFHISGNMLMVVTDSGMSYFFNIGGIGGELEFTVREQTYIDHYYDNDRKVYVCFFKSGTYSIYSYDLDYKVLIPNGRPVSTTDDLRFIRVFMSPNGLVGFAGVAYAGGVPQKFVKYLNGIDMGSANSFDAGAIAGFLYGQAGLLYGDDYVFVFATNDGVGIPFSRAMLARNIVSETTLLPTTYMIPYEFRYIYDRLDSYLWTNFADNKMLFNSIKSRNNILAGVIAPMSATERYESSASDQWLGTVSSNILDNDTTNTMVTGWTVSGAWFNHFVQGSSEHLVYNDLAGVSGGYIMVNLTKMRNVMNLSHGVVRVGITHCPLRYYGTDLFDTTFLYGYDMDNGISLVEAVNKWYFYSKHDVKTGLFDVYINNFRFSDLLSDSEVTDIKMHIENVIRDVIWMIKPITSELRYIVWNGSNR